MEVAKTLYVRGVDPAMVEFITKHHMIEGFKTRGEFINSLLKSGLKTFKAVKKSEPKKVAKTVKKATKKVTKTVKKATKKVTKKAK